MRLFFLFLCLISLSSCVRQPAGAPVQPQEEEEYPETYLASTGPALYGNEAFSWVNTAKGSIELDHAWVTNGVMTDESLTAVCSDIAGLRIGEDAWIRGSFIRGNSQVEGVAQLYESEVKGAFYVGEELIACDVKFLDEVEVEGNISAQNCVFAKDILATSEIITLSGTQVGSIWIKATGPYWDKQIVRLTNGSVIQGDLIFESERGRVIADDSSFIQGSLMGGRFCEMCKDYGSPTY